ncbi:hypothetical protein PF004_g4717 [Phytophthora fragariae]|uniref:PiggyBac transposable element-derived protein domain-containing protein n=1 Tax=Phytophthora fragariae TaxID=53985 RepID=A0A6G0PHL9_9STRA|nr:hypothetical protein PF004_g4717 [Phytophthora fragariae]
MVDVNYLAADEDSSDYDSFSSGESDDGQIEDDDQEPDREYNDLDDDFVSDSDAVEIDEAFIASLTIGASDQDKRAIKARQEALRSMQWTATSTEFEDGEMTAYDGMHGEDAHAVVELREQVDRRAEVQHAKQREGQRETVQQIRRRLKSKKSFDDGVLPSTSRRNTTRMFMLDKPHRYGSKMFMTCDSRTAYCHRFEIYADLALVNAFLSHKEAAAMTGKPAMKRGAWFGVLQNQLLQLKTEDFAGVVATPLSASQKRQRTPIRVTHQLEQRDDWVTVSGAQKRRQRSCKVCALLRVHPKKSFSTTFFCERCSLDDAKPWLCNKICRQFNGVNKTCFDIWHDDFDAGQGIPATLGKRVVLRHPGQRAGKRKRTRHEQRLAGDRECLGDKNSDDSH